MAETLSAKEIKALSIQTRQAILKFLSKRPHTATELSQLLRKHVTTVKEHLDYLENTGLVRRVQGTNKYVYYELTEKGHRLFKPAYAWSVVLLLSLLAFVVGLYEIIFVRFQAARYNVEALAQAGAEAAPVVQTGPENLILGVLAIIIALALLWYAMRLRR